MTSACPIHLVVDLYLMLTILPPPLQSSSVAPLIVQRTVNHESALVVEKLLERNIGVSFFYGAPITTPYFPRTFFTLRCVAMHRAFVKLSPTGMVRASSFICLGTSWRATSHPWESFYSPSEEAAFPHSVMGLAS